MKIGVYGSASSDIREEIAKNARVVGGEIAERGHTVITGGCPGLPYEAVQEAYRRGGITVGYSPATSLNDHVHVYNYPVEGFTDFVFIPKNYMHADKPLVCKKYRNVSSVTACDACILIDGRTGTMNEFTIAYDLGKPIGILDGSGGITKNTIDILLRDIEKSSNATIHRSDDPVSLVEMVVTAWKKRKTVE